MSCTSRPPISLSRSHPNPASAPPISKLRSDYFSTTNVAPQTQQRLDYLAPHRPRFQPPATYTATSASTSLSALWTPLSPKSPDPTSPGSSLRTTRRQKPTPPSTKPSESRNRRTSWPPPNSCPRLLRPEATRRRGSDDSHYSSSSSSSSLGSPTWFTDRMKRPNTWPTQTYHAAQGVEAQSDGLRNMSEWEKVELVYKFIQHPEEVSEEDMEEMWNALRARVQEMLERAERVVQEYVLVGQEDWI